MYVVLIIYLVNQVVVQYLWLAKSCVHFAGKSISSVSPQWFVLVAGYRSLICPDFHLLTASLPTVTDVAAIIIKSQPADLCLTLQWIHQMECSSS